MDPFHNYYEENDTAEYQEPLGPSTYSINPLHPMIVASNKDIDLNEFNKRGQAESALHAFSSTQIQSNIPNVESSFPSAIQLTREPEDDNEEIGEVK